MILKIFIKIKNKLICIWYWKQLFIKIKDLLFFKNWCKFYSDLYNIKSFNAKKKNSITSSLKS